MLFLITASKDYENKVTDVTLTDVHSVFCSVTRDAPIWHSVSVYFAGLGISQTFLYTMVVTVKLKKKKTSAFKQQFKSSMNKVKKTVE